jgi:hypothetical protein
MEVVHLDDIFELLWRNPITAANLDAWSGTVSVGLSNLIAAGYTGHSSYFGDNSLSVMEYSAGVAGGNSVQRKISDNPDLVRVHRDCAYNFEKLVFGIETRILRGLRDPSHPEWEQFGFLPVLDRDNPTKWLTILLHLAYPSPYPRELHPTDRDYHIWSINRKAALHAFDLCLIMFFIRQINKNPRLMINPDHARKITHNMSLLGVHFQLPRMRDLFGAPASAAAGVTHAVGPPLFLRTYVPESAPSAGSAPERDPKKYTGFFV